MMLQMYADGLTLTQNIRKPHPHIHVMREETMKLPMYTDGLMLYRCINVQTEYADTSPIRTCDERGDYYVTDVNRWINVHTACTDTLPARTCDEREFSI